MSRFAACWLAMAGLVVPLPWAVAAAQESSPSIELAQELVARERVRAAVAEAMSLASGYHETAEELRNATLKAIDQLLEIGPEAVPYLTNELDQELIGTFFFTAQALSYFDTPESKAALRKAFERASSRPGKFAFARKGWIAYCLAWLGETDVLDQLNEGIHQAGHGKLHVDCPILEACAYILGKASIPSLLGQVDRYYEDETLMSERIYAIRALGRLADPSAVPRLIEVAREPYVAMRRGAIHALGEIGTPEVIPVLVAALEDPDDRVRKFAADILERLAPEGILDDVRLRLESETNTIARGSLYRLVVKLGGVDELETLRRYADRPEPDDQIKRINAASTLESEKALDILAQGIQQPNSGVVLQAIHGLALIGTPEAIELIIPTLASRNWAIVQTATRRLAAIDATIAAPMIADRLLQAEMSRVVIEARIRDRIYVLGQALIDLGYHQQLNEIRQAGSRQRDAELKRFLESLYAQMELLASSGNRVARWREALSSSDDGVRLLAIRRLGRIGNTKAAEVLATYFDAASIEEGEAILRELGEIDAGVSRDLFRRVLVSPEFDPIERLRQRELAAWGARRLGGADQLEALREAVVRRKGRDVRVMIYLALLGGERALPTLEEFRVSRWRFTFPLLGEHQRRLDWIAREIRAGRSLEAIDVPPGRINFP